MDFAAVEAILVDMDGVLYRDAVPLPGLERLNAAMQRLNLRCMCLTNNASRVQADFSRKLAELGFELAPEYVLSSAVATGIVLRQRYPRGTRVFVVGMQGLREALFGDGYFTLADTDVQVVVVGIDFELTYAKLRTATLAIRAGADFIASNGDRTFPAADGLVPGAGAVVAALVAATDRQPEVIGKPGRAMFDAALALLELPPERVIMIGDRLDTDIAGAQAAGIPAVWVASGVHSWADAEAWEPRPAALLPDLAAVLDALEAAR